MICHIFKFDDYFNTTKKYYHLFDEVDFVAKNFKYYNMFKI